MAGHHDVPAELDVAWYSDDNGSSWTLSNMTSSGEHDRLLLATLRRRAAFSQRWRCVADTVLGSADAPIVWPKQNEFLGFDEPQFTELRNGSVLMSLRLDSAGQRGQALSHE